MVSNVLSGLIQYIKYIMQDKIKLEPRNEKGQHHGYWDTTFGAHGWYKGFFVNNEPLGYFITNWFGDENTNYKYYAL
jgi:hypothetical protein